MGKVSDTANIRILLNYNLEITTTNSQVHTYCILCLGDMGNMAAYILQREREREREWEKEWEREWVHWVNQTT